MKTISFGARKWFTFGEIKRRSEAARELVCVCVCWCADGWCDGYVCVHVLTCSYVGVYVCWCGYFCKWLNMCV